MARVGKDKAWKTVETDWRDVVLVCRKCARKLDGGFGPDGDERFTKVLRRALDRGEGRTTKTRRRAIAVVDVGCLDICPKRSVVVVKCSDPRSMILIPEGTAMDDVVERLRLHAGDPEERIDIAGAIASDRDDPEMGNEASLDSRCNP